MIIKLERHVDVCYEVWVEAKSATENGEKVYRIILYVGAGMAKS